MDRKSRPHATLTSPDGVRFRTPDACRIALLEANRFLQAIATTSLIAILASLGVCAPEAAAQSVTVSVGDVSYVEGNAGTINVQVPLTLSSQPTGTFTVQYAIGGGTATAGVDYGPASGQSLSGTLTFSPQWSPSSIGFVVIGDVAVEGNETVNVSIFNATGGAAIGDGEGVLTIVDDEGVAKAPLRSAWQVVKEAIPSINGSAYGKGRYVLVGAGGTVVTSTNAVTWTALQVPEAGELTTVIYGGGQFLATSAGQWVTLEHPARAGVLTSPDGIRWTPRQGAWGSCAAYGGGRYVVVGGGTTAYVSTDGGATWTSHDVPEFQASRFGVASIAYGAGVFVAVGGWSPSQVYTSPDGVSWTKRFEYAGGSLRSVAYVGTNFVAAGDGTIISQDGISWTPSMTSSSVAGVGPATTGGAQGLTAGGVAGDLAAEVTWHGVFISQNGLPADVPGCPQGELCWPYYSYGTRQPGVTGDLTTITWGHAGFVAAGPNGAIFASPDGQTWQSRTLPDSRSFTDVVWTGSRYCAVGAVGITATSTDGLAWSYGSLPLPEEPGSWPIPSRVVSAGALSIAIQNVESDAYSMILTSPDCEAWTNRLKETLAHEYHLYDVAYGAYGDGVLVAVGYKGTYGPTVPGILRSADNGATWSAVDTTGLPPEAGGILTAVAFGNGHFVATGYSGGGTSYLITSDDGGSNWTSHPSPFHPDPAAITYGNGVFVAAALWQIWTSVDGVTWTMRSQCCNLFQNITFADGHFVMVGGGSQVGGDADIAASEDGATWVPNARPTRHALQAVAYSPELEQWAALGDSVILRSSSYEPPTVWINDTSVTEGNAGSQVVSFPVVLSYPSSQEVAVSYTTANGTATAGTDYQAVTTPQPVIFPAGTWVQNAPVTVFGDTLPEPDQTFTVNLGDPVNATIADGQATGTILNDDGALSISDGSPRSVTEGNAGVTPVTFTVTLANASGTDAVTVQYFSASNSFAVPGLDFEAVSGTLTLTPPSNSATITVNVYGDTLGEDNESFVVNLTNPANAVIARSTGNETILDDEPPPTVSINDVMVPEGNTATSTAWFSVSLSSYFREPIAIDYATSNGTATAPGDYIANTGSFVIDPGLRSPFAIPISIVGDTAVEGTETFTVTLSNARYGGTPITITKDVGTATILDDEGVTLPSTAATWTLVEEGMPQLNGIATDGSQYVVVGQFGEIWTSRNDVAWTQRANPDRNPASGAARALRGVTYGSGRWVAVGQWDGQTGDSSRRYPIVLTSVNAISWTRQDVSAVTQNVNRNLFGVAYGAGLYVAVGGGGCGPSSAPRTTCILTSPDGVSWTYRPSPINSNLNGVAFGTPSGHNLFVAVGPNRMLLTSPDGIWWTQGDVPWTMPTNLNAVAWNGSQFVVVGGDTAGLSPGLMTSPDGVTWTEQTVPAEVTGTFNGVGSGGGLTVAVSLASPADLTGSSIVTSSDGVTWTRRNLSSLPVGVSPSLRIVGYGPVGFVGGGNRGTIWTSPDGTTPWTSRTLAASRGHNGIAFGNGVFCSVGINGSIRRSADGTSWTQASSPPGPQTYYYWAAVIYAGGWFWTAGYPESVASSADCDSWTLLYPQEAGHPTDPATGELTDLAYGNGTLVAVGNRYATPGSATSYRPLILTFSNAGSTWTERTAVAPPGVQQSFATVAFGNGRFVAFGSEARTVELFLNTSTDGTTWTAHPTDVFDNGSYEGVSRLAFGRGLFVAVDGRIWTSPDGISWTLRKGWGPGSENFLGVAYGSERFVAVGNSGTAYVSADGMTWTPGSIPTDHTLRAVAASSTSSRLVAVGDSAVAYTDLQPPVSPPVISIGDASVPEGGSATTLPFIVSLSWASTQTVTVQYATANGTATAGSDYQTASGTLTFQAGETQKTLSVGVLGDGVYETAETVFVDLARATNAKIGDGTGVGTILNDDPKPALTIRGSSVTEGNSGTTPLTFTVTLSPASGAPATVSWATRDGSATLAGRDYTAGSGILSFSPGETSKTITVRVRGDRTRESDETLFVDLTAPVDAVVSVGTATGTIRNDDN